MRLHDGSAQHHQKSPLRSECRDGVIVVGNNDNTAKGQSELSQRSRRRPILPANNEWDARPDSRYGMSKAAAYTKESYADGRETSGEDQFCVRTKLVGR